MQNQPSEHPKPVIVSSENNEAAGPTLNQLLIRSGTLTQRLINLLRQDEDCPIDPQIFISGELQPEHRDQRVIWDSGCDNGLGLQIKREGEEKNDLTHVTISFYPHDHDRFNIFSDIEYGLSREWVAKNKPALNSSGHRIGKYLQTAGSKGMDLVTIKLIFSRYADQKDQPPAQPHPIAIQVSVELSDDSVISFDPLIHYEETIEERGVYSRLVYQRILEKLASSIEQEEIITIGITMKKAFRGKNIFDRKDDDKDLEDEEFPITDPKELN